MARHPRSRPTQLLDGHAGSRRSRTARIDLAQASVVRWPRMLRLLRARPGRAGELGGARPLHGGVVGGLPEPSPTSPARASSSTRRVCRSSRSRSASCPASTCAIAQVIRDPRAVVYSWKRSKITTDRDTGEYMPKFSASFSTTSWLARNLVVEAIRRRGPVEVVQYDDDGARSGRRAAPARRRSSASRPATMEFLTSETATIAPTHSVGGNPMRMTSGAITIEPDEEWRDGIAPRDRVVATAIALPLLHRYGLPGSQRERGRDAARPATGGRSTTRPSVAALPTLTTNAWLRFDAHPPRPADRATDHRARDRRRRGRPRLVARRALHLHRCRARRPVTCGRRSADRRRRARRRSTRSSPTSPIAISTSCARSRCSSTSTTTRYALEAVARVPAAVGLVAPERARAPRPLRRRRRARRSLPPLRARRRSPYALENAGFEVVRFSSYGAGLRSRAPDGCATSWPRRVLAKQGEEGDTPEERTSGSGRLFQPRRVATAVACATVAAPARLVQAPFAGSDLGTGYVVLARRSE